MKKIFFLFLSTAAFLGLSGTAVYQSAASSLENPNQTANLSGERKPITDSSADRDPPKDIPVSFSNEAVFELFREGEYWGKYSRLEDAVSAASGQPHSSVRRKGETRWVWDNYPPFDVFLVGSSYAGGDSYAEFDTFAGAAGFAREQDRAFVYYRKNNRLIWDNTTALPVRANTSVPLTLQMPELPRGCEVTSLAMLLSSQSVRVDKMTLAERVSKDETPYEVKNGKIYYGNPHKGFVGHMSDFQKNGYGVYHEPIYNLLLEYLPMEALDLTGCEYADLEYFLALHTPVWVIINSTYAPLDPDSFVTWHTADGPVKITYREHSVLLTGYDGDTVYFNDPLGGEGEAEKVNFALAWEQMGRQAITCAP
ncbi:MAG: C39 family peptidase [Clostridiales bacterium]|nr:C39 family peptidase [Clostridiales bacterium]